MAWPFRWLGRLGNEEDGLSDEEEWLLEAQSESDSNGEGNIYHTKSFQSYNFVLSVLLK